MQIKYALIIASLVAASGCAASAQSPAQTAPTRAGSNCAPTQTDPQQGSIAPRANTTGSAEPLSDKLAKSDGVLCPPTGVDAEIHAPTPNTGTMPVIPLPGSPGGEPSVRPK